MTARDELAELIAELRSPYAGPGGQSSRSIAQAIVTAGWRLHPPNSVWRCDNDHWERPGDPCICNGGTQDLLWGEVR